jgi:hypothetical protein
LENAFRAKQLNIKAQYEKHIRELEEAYGEPVRQICV